MIKYEIETVINFNAEEENGTVYSCMSFWWTKCEKLGLKLKEEYKNQKGKIIAKTYYIPKKWIKITKPAKRNFTDEQKKRLSDHMKKLAQQRKLKIDSKV